MADTDTNQSGHRTLKDILHELLDAVDLAPGHRAELHEAVDIHDDPAAQREKDQEKSAEWDAEAADLQAKLDAINARRAPTPADKNWASSQAQTGQPASVGNEAVNSPSVPVFSGPQGNVSPTQGA